MTNWDLIKKGISKEIKSIINTIDPAFDVDNCLNLYSKVLKFKISIPTKNDLDGLEKAVNETLVKNFIDGQINDDSVGLFCKNFEQFIKQIYYILEQSNFICSEYVLDHTKLQALNPYLTILNKIRPIYLDVNNNDVFEVEFAAIENGAPKYKFNTENCTKLYKRLYPSSLNLDSYSDVNDTALNEKYQNNFLLYFIKAVILKNEQSHQVPERSRLANVTNFNSTLIAQLWIINFFKKELASAIKIDSYRNRDFDDYVNNELDRLKKQSSKFVSLNLKELSNQSDKGRSGFIEELLSDNLLRIRILGQGGSGKTTTLEYLFYKDALNWVSNPTNSKLPVLISLANISQNETILGNIAKKINVEIEYIEELLETNEIKIYLDGINEIVSNRESKKTKLQEISSLLEDYPKLRLIITDRYEFDSYQSNMFNVPTFLIQKLSINQIEEFVNNYCNHSHELSTHVMNVLLSKKSIQEILLRPLVLTRAIEIIKIDDDLPEKEGQIIEKFLDILDIPVKMTSLLRMKLTTHTRLSPS